MPEQDFEITKYSLSKESSDGRSESKYVLNLTNSGPEKIRTISPFVYAMDQCWADLSDEFGFPDRVLYIPKLLQEVRHMVGTGQSVPVYEITLQL